jgi:hypothetical protein
MKFDIDSIEVLFICNFTTVIVINTRAITFFRKSNTFFKSKLRSFYVSRTNCIKETEILFDSKLFFHVHFIFLNHSVFVSHL